MKVFYQLSLLTLVLVSHRSQALPVQDVSAPGMPFQLSVTPAFVNRYTASQMTLRCQHDPAVDSELVEIFRIRIVKQSPSGWDLVAEQLNSGNSLKVSGNATALADTTGDSSNAFLQVFWETIGPECFGVFKCYAMGLDSAGEVLTERSSTLELYEFKNFIHRLIGMSADTQEKVLEMENFTDTELARLNFGLQRLTQSIKTNQSLVENNVDRLEDKLNTLEARVGNQVVSVETRVTRIENFFSSSSQWPTGSYALLKPRSGCPVHVAFAGSNRSYQKLHTQSQSSSDPQDSHSSAFSNNTLSTVDSKNFVTLEFCEVAKQDRTVMWPQGSFCVNKHVDQSCPAGFTDGHVHYDTEDTDESSDARNSLGGTYDLNFCCQNTASATVPIQLPTDSPFLLYRYGGVCQAVQGMSVSEEFIQINTEDSSNFDILSGRHPDIDQPGSSVIKYNLCYYTKL